MPGTATVTVASKLSFPLILTVNKGHWIDMQGPQGSFRHFVIESREQHTVRGFGAARRLESNGDITGETSRVIGDYGLTPGIPQEFMEQWLFENKDSEYVKGGFIFVHSKQSMVLGYAKEHAQLMCGAEALIPQTFDRAGNRTSRADPRIGGGISTRVDE